MRCSLGEYSTNPEGRKVIIKQKISKKLD